MIKGHKMKQMCKKTFQSLCVCRNELLKPRWLTVQSLFTEYSKATGVRKLYTAYTGVVVTNSIPLFTNRSTTFIVYLLHMSITVIHVLVITVRLH